MLLRAYRDGSEPRDADGWLATGDAGYIEADGRLVVHGRLSEMIISGGENIWPTAVESVLVQHPLVAEAGVAGVTDAEWGERVVAYLVTTPGADTEAQRLLEELRDLVRSEISPFAAPRQVVLVPSLPRTVLGKIRRDALRPLRGHSAAV
jgi:acyl-coenzyme A synthetase/AMP-(fatty) acid ligase